MKSMLLKISTHDFVKLLSDRPYAYFLLSVVFSQVAFNMMNVVLIFVVFNLTSSNFLVSMILLISLIPQVFLSFIGGIVADTRNKKKILVFGNLGRAFFVLPLFYFNDSLAPVYTLALLISIVTQFYLPAETPVIPHIVPEKLLVPANSLFGLALFGSILIGYVVAGPALLSLGHAYVFLVIAVFFLLAGLFAYLIPYSAFQSGKKVRKRITVEVEETLRSYLVNTYKILHETAGVASSFVLLILSQVVIMILAVIVPGYAKEILKIQVENVSLLLFAPAALGMIVSAFIVGSVLKKANRAKLMNTGVFVSGIILLLLPLMSKVTSRDFITTLNLALPSYLEITVLHMVVFLAFFAGVGNALIFIPAQTTIQEKIPDNFRSKIYGLLFAVTGLFSFLPIVLVGGLADTLGVNSVLIILGTVIIVGEVIQLLAVKYIKRR